jgi:hypothetical protein
LGEESLYGLMKQKIVLKDLRKQINETFNKIDSADKNK